MKKIFVSLMVMSHAITAFANQSYSVSCTESYIEPISGEELQIFGEKTHQKWTRFIIRENQTYKKTSRLDPEHKYRFSVQGSYSGQVSSRLANAQVQFPGGFSFEKLFYSWTGGTAETSMKNNVQLPVKGEFPPESPIQEQMFSSSNDAIPTGLLLTNQGDLNVVSYFKPGLFRRSRIVNTDPAVTASNWKTDISSRNISRTIHVYQPLGSNYWIKLLCDKSVR
jgi:hypothetical protein